MEPYRIDDWMRQEQLRRQALFTDLFAGRPVEHIPLEIRVSDNAYSVREHYLDGDKQCADGLRSVQLTWDLGEHTDAIPCFFADVGCSCIANAFGAPYEFLGGPDQTPSVRRRVLDDPDDLETQVAGLSVPDLANAQWISEGLRRPGTDDHHRLLRRLVPHGPQGPLLRRHLRHDPAPPLPHLLRPLSRPNL